MNGNNTTDDLGLELRLMATVARGLYQNYRYLQRAELPILHHDACMAYLANMSLELQHLFHVKYKKELLERMIEDLKALKRDLVSYFDTDKLPVSHILVLPFAHYDEDTDTRLLAV